MSAATVPSPPDPTSTSTSIPVRLSDGAVVELRPIGRDDGGALRAFLDGLSDRSRYLRFHSPVPTVSAALLELLVDTDGFRHAAWAAWADGEIVAEGRWHRDPARPEVAELGFAVAERWQGRGLGRVVVDTLVASACAAGAREVVADVLPENHAASGLLRSVGARIGWSDGHVVGRISVVDDLGVPACA